MIRQKMVSKSRAVTPRTKPSKNITKRKSPKPARANDEARERVVLTIHPEPEDSTS